MRVFTLLLLITLHFGAMAQNPMYNSSNKKAQKAFDAGLDFYRKRQFDAAKAYFEKAVSTDPNFINAHAFLANMYKQIYFDKENWVMHVEKVAQLAPKAQDMAPLVMDYASYLFSEGDYEQSLPYLKQVVASHPRQPEVLEKAQKLQKEAAYGIYAMKNPLPFSPVKLNDNINFADGNYLPSLTADQSQLMYTALLRVNKQAQEDVMISQKKDGVWQKAVSISPNINTSSNEGASTISGDGQTMVFTRCGDLNGFGRCDLYVSYREGNGWSKPENLGASINADSWDSQPSLSTDGRTLYFVSDRKGGYGREDIYVAEKIDDTTWGIARNLGDKVNTSEREMSPFIHANGQTLYYATTGLYETNLGGFDLFRFNVATNEGPDNLGYPVNTSKDETTLFITADSKQGYFSKDEAINVNARVTYLYEFEVPEAIKPHAAANYAIGEVYDVQTNNKLPAVVEVYNLKSDVLVQKVKADAEGRFLCTLNEGDEYAVFVTHPGYLHESVNFNYTAKSSEHPEALKIGLKKVSSGQSIVLNNIFFETGSYALDDKSKSELDKLIKLLQENPSVKVEVSGHTDDVGNNEDNKKLSDNRAKSVKSYLEDHQIAKGRIVAVGWGETKPIVANDSDDNRARNRRIECKVL